MLYVGIDPGLVDTGVVMLQVEPGREQQTLFMDVVPRAEIQSYNWSFCEGAELVTIEGYRKRLGHRRQDPQMVQLVRDVQALCGSKAKSSVLDNMGVKQIITDSTLMTLGLWSFQMPSHHQDVRAATRIMLYGMAKNEEANPVLFDLIWKAVEYGWTVKQHPGIA